VNGLAGEALKDGESFQESSDHFDGHPKTAGRTFTGGAERNLNTGQRALAG
jgi:hypothetical protein